MQRPHRNTAHTFDLTGFTSMSSARVLSPITIPAHFFSPVEKLPKYAQHTLIHILSSGHEQRATRLQWLQCLQTWSRTDFVIGTRAYICSRLALSHADNSTLAGRVKCSLRRASAMMPTRTLRPGEQCSASPAATNLVFHVRVEEVVDTRRATRERIQLSL